MDSKKLVQMKYCKIYHNMVILPCTEPALVSLCWQARCQSSPAPKRGSYLVTDLWIPLGYYIRTSTERMSDMKRPLKKKRCFRTVGRYLVIFLILVNVSIIPSKEITMSASLDNGTSIEMSIVRWKSKAGGVAASFIHSCRRLWTWWLSQKTTV